VDVSWTLNELVTQAVAATTTLPAPKNGQVRAVPDERTVRYYQTIGLLDRPAAMRGRTALYTRKHLAQVVAIKRLQSAGRSLAEIQAMWPSLDDHTLARMSGIELGGKGRAGRREFWKREARASATPPSATPPASRPQPGRPALGPQNPPGPRTPPIIVPDPGPVGAPAGAPVVGLVVPASGPADRTHDTRSAPIELRVELGSGTYLVVGLSDDLAHTIHPADVRALRAAAAPLVAELARRGLIARPEGTLEES
jgi:DNA-binding transcriptional MerR regulator